MNPILPTQELLPFEDWRQAYRVILCLKKTSERETWLLEEQHGTGRLILKKASKEQLPRLKSEYELLKNLTDKQDFPILFPTPIGFRTAGGCGWMLREYVSGKTLSDLIEYEGISSVHDTARFGVKLCRQIGRLHSMNPSVIHRDIKPENIVVTETGNVRLIDFDTIRYYTSGQNADTVCMGTRGYAAPEQFGFGQTDVRSDIYAVGKVLLYLSAGGYETADLQSLKNPDEKRLKKIILRCCAYDPEKRYQNTDQLLHDLEHLMNFPAKANRIIHTMASLLVFLCIAVIFLGFQNQRLQKQFASLASTASEHTDLSNTENKSSPSWNPYTFEPMVKEILQFYGNEQYGEMAEKCEELVKLLSGSEVISQTETIAYWQLSEADFQDYQTQRIGYEYIADRLAYQDALPIRYLGSYIQNADTLANAIRQCIEYTWTNADGSQAHSPLSSYWNENDNRNMDGCIIDLLNCINQTLENTQTDI